jgi:hypothetical protein
VGGPAGTATGTGTPGPAQVTGQPGVPGSQAPIGSGGSAPTPPARRSGRGWLIGLIAAAVAVLVVAVLVVRGLGGVLGGVPGLPGNDPSADVCPRPEASGTAGPQPNDGRVHSGPLSYPMLPAPWESPVPENDVPFGRDVLQQFVQTEEAPAMRWGAAVMVGELVAGDGFYAPKDGAEIVLRCVTGTFSGNAEVTRHDTKSQAMTVDGHDAWVMESDLSFAIPDIEATNELLTVVIVDLEDGSAGLFASSDSGLLSNITLWFPGPRGSHAQAADREGGFRTSPSALSTMAVTRSG